MLDCSQSIFNVVPQAGLSKVELNSLVCLLLHQGLQRPVRWRAADLCTIWQNQQHLFHENIKNNNSGRKEKIWISFVLRFPLKSIQSHLCLRVSYGYCQSWVNFHFTLSFGKPFNWFQLVSWDSFQLLLYPDAVPSQMVEVFNLNRKYKMLSN